MVNNDRKWNYDIDDFDRKRKYDVDDFRQAHERSHRREDENVDPGVGVGCENVLPSQFWL